MTHLAVRPQGSSMSNHPVLGILALLVACLFTLLAPNAAMADDNDCVQQINQRITAIDRALRHKLITQTQIQSVLAPLVLNEGACLTAEQREHLRERIRSTDTLPVVLSIGTLALDIITCHENGDITDEQFTELLSRLESLLTNAERISMIQFRLLALLSSIPECD